MHPAGPQAKYRGEEVLVQYQIV